MDGAVLAEKLSEQKYAANTSAFNISTSNAANDDIFFQQSNDEFAFLRAKFDALPEFSGQLGESAEETAEKAAQAAAMIKRQLKIEEAQLLEASDLYQETFKNLAKMGRGTAMKSAQKLMLQWYEPLVVALKKEILAIRAGELGTSSHFQHYGPYLVQLPVEKLAVITLTTMLNCTLRNGNTGTKLVSIAMEISDMVEAESHVFYLKQEKEAPFWQKKLLDTSSRVANVRALNSFNNRLRKVAKGEMWTDAAKAKVGTKLIDVLLKTAVDDKGVSAFVYSNNFYVQKLPYASKQTGQSMAVKRMGFVHMEPAKFLEFSKLSLKDSTLLMPRYLPMLVPPKRWDNREFSGAYFTMKAPMMKAISAQQRMAVRHGELNDVLDALDYLGQTGWRINPVVHTVIKDAWAAKLSIAELPGADPLPMPEESACFRTVREINASKERYYARREAEEEMKKKAAEERGEVYTPPAVPIRDPNAVIEDPDEVRFDERFYKYLCSRVAKKNGEMHSIRCDVTIKLNIAEKFKDEVMFFPHNIDFRGRAYPIPPNLSHLGNDFCRGIMMFDKAKKLGPVGLRWLKIHVTNLFGNNKISLDDRVKWADANMDKIRASVAEPLGGERWWSTAEEPFQALAAMAEIVKAIDSGNPEEYMCSLAVHQDGSCNGLQHYAGLGRDAQGGAAVNLVPHDVPQDVYSKVLTKVLAKVEADAELPDNDPRALEGICARIVRGYVSRKVIKQTVMTSVYGVTQSGARAQVEARLHEVLQLDNGTITPEREKEVSAAAAYLAKLTLLSLSEMFSSARGIMDWLGTCAKLVAQHDSAMSWVTPLGLPVIQPYRKIQQHTVSTVMQSITLTEHSDLLPISLSKQKSAFPPNFVHSMDATHMMMTCLKMKKLGLTFAAVHDSYWTHPSDIPVMNDLLREAFVELYSLPLLEDLRDSLEMRFPDIDFPPLPERGQLDINLVKSSQFFFH